jgi:hypothetical protein
MEAMASSEQDFPVRLLAGARADERDVKKCAVLQRKACAGHPVEQSIG